MVNWHALQTCFLTWLFVGSSGRSLVLLVGGKDRSLALLEGSKDRSLVLVLGSSDGSFVLLVGRRDKSLARCKLLLSTVSPGAVVHKSAFAVNNKVGYLNAYAGFRLLEQNVTIRTC